MEDVDIVKDWKYYVGMTLFCLSFILPLFSFAIPSFGLSTATTATIIAFLTVGSPEICLLLSVIFLGKKVLNHYKKKIFTWFKRALKPVSKSRYYFGIALMLATSIPFYVYAYMSQVSDYSARLYILVASDLVFIFSFFIVGGEFWDKLKRLFIWEGGSSASKDN